MKRPTPKITANDKVETMRNNYDNGVIVICPTCGKVDIDPYVHFSNCSPQAESRRREDNEYYD